MTLVTSVIEMLLDLDINLLNLICYVYFTTSVLVFSLLAFGITAPYGRYSRGGWGMCVNGRFAWFVQEIPSFVVPLFLLTMDSPYKYAMPNLLLLGMFLVHYFQRSCIFPFLIKGGKPTPMIPFLMALLFCFVNGYLQAGHLLYHAHFGVTWWLRPHIWAGVALFVSGMCINIHSDHVLRNLRKPGETGYKIPRGGMFELISGANFFGEMLEWTGFAIATWSLPGLAFAVFTCLNIGPRAYQHHKYYLEKFEDYPKTRKAVIPFVI